MRKTRGIRIRLSLVALVLAAVIAPLQGATGAGEWKPGPALYDVGRKLDIHVRMADGVELLADVYFPVNPATGRAAPGPFPVILTQTPYGKQVSTSLGALGGSVNPYLVSRGYIHAVADIRGTGGSQGTWAPLDPIQGRDGAALVRWAAALPRSNGTVGTIGPSYLGLIQLLTAAEIGPNSPLKAIFPIVVGADLYRDVIFQGGIVDIEFDAWYLPLTAVANLGNPILESSHDPAGLAAIEAQHARGIVDFHAGITANVLTGGDRAYYGSFWKQRTPLDMVPEIVSNGIPAFIAGGWNDLFQRGTPLLYSGFQNAYFGRPIGDQMRPQDLTTGRYQLLMAPWYHVQYGEGLDLDAIALRWFDTWLKDAATGMADTDTPLHTYQMGDGRWFDVARYPFEEAPSTTLYFGAGGSLTPNAPAAGRAADAVVFTGVSNPCTKGTQQWGAGAVILAGSSGFGAPCADPTPVTPGGPGALSYESAPFTGDMVLAGPVAATIYASSTRPDAQWVLTLKDVAPDGIATTLSTGALLGSFRELDPLRTWTAPGGNPIMPYHRYTRASSRLLTQGEVTRFDIEVFPTFARLGRGHRLRLEITTSDTPHLLPTPHQLVNLIGGVYRVQRNAAGPSSIQVPLVPAGAFADPCELCR